ncbi:OmpA family protein [Pseudomonas panipatensis]|uniref:Type VI secretion system protein VasL n=1 Tax=Pseudomonas panipatensis TaxID=428992 RepID=A0A1G8MA07_9PSED|nr:OmpA family protein [Pseudomonas panipatensis]SDI64200.1 type VI secretion system protein VasL [Pseudomonas panipatensis]SMP76466.1 type VI secretion system protein VasL [Pseudomonas panipatensis]
MTVLSEMEFRLGGDPRGLDAFAALRDEMTKLSHPARPDVDWLKVEQLCMALLQNNGVELQTAACFALLRTQRCGLPGMVEGVALIEALVDEWARLWPPMTSVRVDILAWLFGQLQPRLRGLELTAKDLPTAIQLDAGLARLSERLEHQLQAPVLSLHALRQQVDALLKRLERSAPPGEASPRSASCKVKVTPGISAVAEEDSLAAVTSVANRNAQQRRIAWWLLALAGAIALSGLIGGRRWIQGNAASDPGQPAPAASPAAKIPAPVRLDSLLLFNLGSAELKPGSTKVLVNALVGIKAQPGWLIVIAGHTDATGNAEQNLQLSLARAAAVRDWMQRMGDIPDSCFAVQGFGASQPIASNDTEAGRAANRRVDIRLVPELGACTPHAY